MNFDAFSSGQVLSKVWLAESLEKVVELNLLAQPRQILCLGGWYGLTNFILRIRNRIKIKNFRSLDIDPEVEKIADKINNSWEWQDWQFKSITGDANDFHYTIDDFDTVINTSVEHIESRKWFENIPKDCLVVLQSNDMPHEDHTECHSNLDEFVKEFNLSEENIEDGSGTVTINVSDWSTTQPSYSVSSSNNSLGGISTISLPSFTYGNYPGSTVGGYTTSSGTSSIYSTYIANDSTVSITTEGIDMKPGSDIKIGGKSLSESIEKIEERLGILKPNPELEERWDKLKELRNQYMELESFRKRKDHEDFKRNITNDSSI